MADMELVDIITPDGLVERKALKTEAHAKGWLHKTVIGVLRYEDEWALVRQAADRQDAGQLVAPVGGHVQAGEQALDALLRESEEEIGTRDISYNHLGSVIFHRQVIGRDENHLFVVYEIATSDTITLGSEAVAMERFTPGSLRHALREQPQAFGESLYFLLEKFYPSYLPVTWHNRWGSVSVQM